MSGYFFLVFSIFFFASYFLLDDSYPLRVYVYWFQGACALVCLFVWIFSGGVKKLKQEREKRLLVFTSSSFLYFGLVFPMFVAGNYLAANHEVFFVDFTKEGVFSLSPQSKKILKDINQPVEFKYFVTAPSEGDRVSQKKLDKMIGLLTRVSKEQPLVKLEVLDPEKHLFLMEKLQISEDSTLHISLPEHPQGRWAQLSGIITEQQVFNALKRLFLKERPLIYVSKGFGEGDLTKDFLPFLVAVEGDSFEVKLFDLALEVSIPEKVSAVLLLAPKIPYSDKALQVLEKYVSTGGNLIVFDEPRHQNNVNQLLSEFGVQFSKELIVRPAELDGEVRLDLAVSQLEAHPVSEKVDGLIKTATAQMVEISKESTLQPFFFAPFGSWEEVDEASVFEKPPYVATRSEEERTGFLAISAISPSETKQGRVAVFGDIDFIALKNINVGYNKQLILNTINWITGQDQYLELKAKNLRESVEEIDDQTAGAMFLFSSLLLPQLVVMLGIFFWRKR